MMCDSAELCVLLPRSAPTGCDGILLTQQAIRHEPDHTRYPNTSPNYCKADIDFRHTVLCSMRWLTKGAGEAVAHIRTIYTIPATSIPNLFERVTAQLIAPKLTLVNTLLLHVALASTIDHYTTGFRFQLYFGHCAARWGAAWSLSVWISVQILFFHRRIRFLHAILCFATVGKSPQPFVAC